MGEPRRVKFKIAVHFILLIFFQMRMLKYEKRQVILNQIKTYNKSSM